MPDGGIDNKVRLVVGFVDAYAPERGHLASRSVDWQSRLGAVWAGRRRGLVRRVARREPFFR